MVTSETAFVSLCDSGYLSRAVRTIRDLRGRGGWKGDIVLICVGFTLDESIAQEYNIIQHNTYFMNTAPLLEAFHQHPIKRMADDRHTKKLTQWNKLQVFTEFFKQWKRIVFLDAGLRVLDSVEPLLALDYTGKLLAPDDSDPYDNGNRIRCQFDQEANPAIAEIMLAEFSVDLDAHYFLNCMFVFDTELITADLFTKLSIDMTRFPIMMCNEMGLMNLWFTCKLKVWEPFPQRVGEKWLFGWSEYNYNPRPDWNAFHFLKYPATIGMDQD